MDNAFVIHDYNGFNIWINNEKAATTVPANDGKWHHLAFTWKSSTGQWKVYKDGAKVKSSTKAFQQYKVWRQRALNRLFTNSLSFAAVFCHINALALINMLSNMPNVSWQNRKETMVDQCIIGAPRRAVDIWGSQRAHVIFGFLSVDWRSPCS